MREERKRDENERVCLRKGACVYVRKKMFVCNNERSVYVQKIKNKNENEDKTRGICEVIEKGNM